MQLIWTWHQLTLCLVRQLNPMMKAELHVAVQHAVLAAADDVCAT